MSDATTQEQAPVESAEQTPAAQPPAEETAQESQDKNVEVSDVELPEAAESSTRQGGGQIDILLDTTMNVSVVLGETTIPVSDLLGLGSGSVIKLDKQVGQPVDLYLRGIRFATGQIVVVGDSIGVRVKEILSGSA